MKMQLFILFAVIFSIAFVPTVYAHEPNFTIRTSEDILGLCNFFYEEYNLLGAENFKDHHKLFLNANICPTLYENIAWYSNHPQRNYVLLDEIQNQLNTNSNYLKEKHLKSSLVPVGFEKKAKLWVAGEIRNTEFLNAIEEISNFDFSKQEKIQYERICSNLDSCLKENDYVKYTITNQKGEKGIIKFEILDIESNEVIVGSKPTTTTIGIETTINNEKENVEIQLNKQRQIPKSFQHQYIDRLIFTTPVKISEKIEDEFYVIGNAEYNIDNTIRDGYLADNQKGKLIKIDKKTGLILSLKYEDKESNEFFEMELESTSIFESIMFVEYKQTVIPKWFKDNVEWYLDEIISEKEFLNSIKYL